MLYIAPLMDLASYNIGLQAHNSNGSSSFVPAVHECNNVEPQEAIAVVELCDCNPIQPKQFVLM